MPALTSEWVQLSVGCHWINAAYPQAVVSSIATSRKDDVDPIEGERFDIAPTERRAYVAVVNFSHLGTFATRELAQHYVEAYLGTPPALRPCGDAHVTLTRNPLPDVEP